MATLVSFHAHPDDETVLCGGTLYLAAQAGHRVVLVCATDGQRGEYPDSLLEPGESLAERRAVELADAARILGIARVVHLGYRDSGMLGHPGNDDPDSFHAADVEQAAGRLASLLTEESATLLTVYDHHGTYDHPDHVQVHRVGVRAAELAGTPEVLEATLCRDRIARMRAHVAPAAADQSRVEGTDEATIGLAESELNTRVDLGPALDTKRAALAAHASQYPEQSFFRQLPDEAFAIGFGTEWYRRRPTSNGRSRPTYPFVDN
jgi:LmbE family N-acetylglucosaminyl deacetylase